MTEEEKIKILNKLKKDKELITKLLEIKGKTYINLKIKGSRKK